MLPAVLLLLPIWHVTHCSKTESPITRVEPYSPDLRPGGAQHMAQPVKEGTVRPLQKQEMWRVRLGQGGGPIKVTQLLT